MADDGAVVFSLGHVEGWITKVAETYQLDAQGTLTHLKVVEEAFNEYRKKIGMLRGIIRELKDKTDAASHL